MCPARIAIVGLALAISGSVAPMACAATWEDVIKSSFTSYSALESKWNYLY